MATTKENTMWEKLLIEHCSPTLAGLKTANLFSCPYQNKNTLANTLYHLNQTLLPKGLRVMPLRFNQERALIYIYRPRLLKADFANSRVASLLAERGYAVKNPQQCLLQLIKKLHTSQDFPHEIGLFLGYPPEDVQGFIDNKQCCKCGGFWKVYGDEKKTTQLFAQYKKCTKAYCNQWQKGKSVEQLAVAV